MTATYNVEYTAHRPGRPAEAGHVLDVTADTERQAIAAARAILDARDDLDHASITAAYRQL